MLKLVWEQVFILSNLNLYVNRLLQVFAGMNEPYQSPKERVIVGRDGENNHDWIGHILCHFFYLEAKDSMRFAREPKLSSSI